MNFGAKNTGLVTAVENEFSVKAGKILEVIFILSLSYPVTIEDDTRTPKAVKQV